MKASIVIAGLAAAVLAGCGSPGSAAGASSGSSAASPSPGRGFGNGSAVTGQVVQLSSGKLTVSGQGGNGQTRNTTVTYDSKTMVLQSGIGSLADVVTGVCVVASGTKDAGGSITATTFQAQLNMNGSCATPAGLGGGQGPRASASPGQFPGGGGPGANPNFTAVRGKVSSVSGSTVMVQPQNGAAVTVTIPSTVQVTRLVTSTTARLAVGLCVSATGQRSSGDVKAQSIVISAPGPNGCVRAGGFGGGLGGRGRPSPSPSGQTA